ncbi:helicase-related protein [Clostridium cylindrosporum]|uniref:RNA helicase n=1 Tax=Clostridium cylindrosporum DSM 605 TaxID=1121307 RepID=A0A0J8DB22_CLOCY|nr:helicase-related protein [Clostridium cylindrosporum]KMT21498.1 superfamily II DNA and RNA helicase [Clostridium cylindrosporum DSM 605]
MQEKFMCVLSDEMEDRVNRFTDNIIRNEIAKQIVLYIKNKKRFKVKEEKYDYDDNKSKIKMIEIGSFNPKEYETCDEFMWEPTGEIKHERRRRRKYYSYITIKDKLWKIVTDELNGNLANFIEEFLGTIDFQEELIYQEFYIKVKNSKRKPIDITEEEYRDIEFSKIFSMEIESYISSNFWDVEELIEDISTEEFYDIYTLGCKELGINTDYIVDMVSSVNKKVEKELVNILKEKYTSEKIYNPSFRVKTRNIPSKINKLKGKIDKLIDREVTTTNKSMILFISMAKECILEYLACGNFAKRGKDNNVEFPNAYIESKLPELINKIAMVETYIYEEYKKIHKGVPSIKELMKYKDCQNEFTSNNIIFIIENLYVTQSTKEKISKLIPLNPKEEYPKARRMKRKFTIHVGETNTGKTYSSLEKLKSSGSGVYLSPLRLLALEVQEKLNSDGIPCSLSTGEEENIISNANHISSTVEKVDLSSIYDICVIDECQMIGDTQRGFAWTRAILGVLAKEVHLCTAPEGLDILIKLIKECNDEYEVVEHVRNTKLVFVDKNFNLKRDIEKGDALIVFSKKKVLAVASDLLNRGIKTSVIYGALPYATRKGQFQRFLNGDTDVVVSTDAIGMGLNLPIKRIIFLETSKFDGEDVRKLKDHEIKQISGRAGRKGIYDVGYVLSAQNGNLIEKGLNTEVKPIKEIFTGFPEVLLDIEEDLSYILKVWEDMPTSRLYHKTDIERDLNLIQILKRARINVPNKTLLRMISIPFSEKSSTVLQLWLEYCQMYTKKVLNLKRPDCEGKELEDLEDYYKCLDLYYSFSKNFNLYIDLDWLSKEKLKTANNINEILINSLGKSSRSCKKCGNKLAWDYPHKICSECYNDRHYNTRYYYKY